ncbi:MAG: hypothetical protein E7Z88_03625 [Cyanobacteria bacterium SIG27]|nr:hypothetical protein [Cyanobacteria bacterium SIG27]
MKHNLKRKPKDIIEKFKALSSREDVADLLEISDKQLRYYLYSLSDTEKYTKFNIPKKNGGSRDITAPIKNFKLIQKNLAHILYLIHNPRICSYGFEKNYKNKEQETVYKGICPNAKLHINKNNVLNVDLKDFFTSINFGRVRGMFMALPHNFSSDVATVIAQICCTNNALPQGAPTSPIISNMILKSFDSKMLKLVKPLKCTYSRYADDITISTNLKTLPKEIYDYTQNSISTDLNSIIEDNGFEVNKQKIRLQTKIQRQSVTGLIVNKKTNVPRDYIKNIRALLFRWEKDGEENADKYFQEHFKKCKLRRVLLGRISHIGNVRGVEDPIFIKLWNKYHILIGQSDKIKALISEDKEILTLISKGENSELEFKQAYEYSQDEKRCNNKLYYRPQGKKEDIPTMKHKVLKTVCAFLNSNSGGTLLLGVEDNSTIRGLKEDIKNNKNNLDSLALSIDHAIKDNITPSPIGNIKTKFYKIHNKYICKIDIEPYYDPVYLKTHGGIFYVRHDVESVEIKEKDKIDQWIRAHNKLQRN